MAVNQTTYSDNLAPAYAGMIANGEVGNRISRTCEDAGGLGFGKAAYRGADDHGCTGVQALTASAAAQGTNTGNGTFGTITPSAGAVRGKYVLTIIEPGTNAGTFALEDSNGVQVGHGAVAAAFSSGGMAFTLSDGSNDFAAGDSFVITVAGNELLGITIAHEALALLPGADADEYPQYENVAILTGGTPIWVKAGGTVADGDDVFIDGNGDFVATSGIPAKGWKFDTTGVDDDLVKIVKRI